MDQKLEQYLWTPCSQKQPDDNGYYLVTAKRTAPEDLGGNSVRVKTMRFLNGEWKVPVILDDYVASVVKEEVLAWQELPEPYQEPNITMMR